MAVERHIEMTGTRSAILDSAERLVQSRGFNGFSYADVASQLGITKAALHYHFPGKAELGEALIVRYAARFEAALEAIDASGEPAPARLRAYAELYSSVLREERMCLCGMLAAEYATLPAAMRQTVVSFFDLNYTWLGQLLQAGESEGTLAFAGTPEAAAQMIVGTLEGAMLVARPYGDSARFDVVAKLLLTELTPPRPGARRR